MSRPYADPGEQTRGTRARRDNAPAGAQPDLFAAPVVALPTRALHGMVRGTDAIESQRAAADMLPGRRALQQRLLEILAASPPQTAGELEARPEFTAYAPSTIRKRLSELGQAARITRHGRRDGMATWTVAHG